MNVTPTSLPQRLFQLLICLAALSVFMAIGMPFIALIAQTRTRSSGYRSDNSDWWSFTRRADTDAEGISQHREPPSSTFQILGFGIDDETFGKARAKLGSATIIERGDASAGRSQICYTSSGKESRIYLIFEKGEVNDAFYLFSGGPDWKGSDRCTASELIRENLSTASGLRLGQTTAQVRAILGKPSVASADKMIYPLDVEKKTSAADFEKLKRQNPGVSQEDLHRTYDSYTLGIFIEARFLGGKLVYLAISKTESY
jgi:hypothetical protein